MPPARRATQPHELEHLADAQTLPDVPQARTTPTTLRYPEGIATTPARGAGMAGCSRAAHAPESVIGTRRPSQPPTDAKSAQTSQFPVDGLAVDLEGQGEQQALRFGEDDGLSLR